jgi:tetratricopeptide (TPR) repeat protein
MGGFTRTASRTLLIIFITLSLCLGSSIAQEPSPELKSQYDRAFAAMMSDLANPELSFQFVKVAIEVGDLRGAIAALERILLINPGLANIQLELGVLYLRVGNAELAQDYLRKAIRAPGIPDAVRGRAERFLLLAETGVTRHLFTGTMYLGGRYDSNANAAPAGRNVRAGGQSALLDEGDTGRDDFSLVGVGNFRYLYVLADQARTETETNFFFVSQRYARSHEIDLGSINWDVGPRFYLGALLNPDLSIRPFVSTSYLWLGDEHFLATYGGGVDLRKFFSNTLYGDARVSVAQQDYQDSSLRPTVSDRTGPLLALDGTLHYQIRPATRLSGGLLYSRRFSRESFESFYDGGFAVSLTQNYLDPFRWTEYDWSSALTIAFSYSSYDQPDPSVDPNVRRHDPRTNIIFSNNMRLTEALTLIVTAQHTINNSNLPNFKFTNTSGSIGIAYRF